MSNYFDTAYAYLNGESEKIVGAALARYPRELLCRDEAADMANRFKGESRGHIQRAVYTPWRGLHRFLPASFVKSL